MSELTREMILAMPASKEMDALVAERVMGWYPKLFNDTELGKKFFSDGINRPWLEKKWNTANYWYEKVNDKDVRRARIIWSPSTNITDAWEVVEKMRRYWGEFDLQAGLVWHCWGNLDEVHAGDDWGYGDTAPLAICRAALLVKINEPTFKNNPY